MGTSEDRAVEAAPGATSPAIKDNREQKTEIDPESAEAFIAEKHIGERIKRLRLKKSMGLVELGRQCLRAAPQHSPGIGRGKAVRHRGDRVGDAGVPQEPALGVFDEIAIVDEVHRFAFVEARRPARNITGDSLAAIEDVEFFHAGLFRLRMT